EAGCSNSVNRKPPLGFGDLLNADISPTSFPSELGLHCLPAHLCCPSQLISERRESTRTKQLMLVRITPKLCDSLARMFCTGVSYTCVISFGKGLGGGRWLANA